MFFVDDLNFYRCMILGIDNISVLHKIGVFVCNIYYLIPYCCIYLFIYIIQLDSGYLPYP
jgi:hypothetical protein